MAHYSKVSNVESERKIAVPETKEDVKKRAYKAIEMQLKHGIQHIRTHVDITDPSFTGLEALLEIREETKNLLDLQIVAFPQEGVYAYPKGDELLEEALKMGADVNSRQSPISKEHEKMA